MVTRPSEGAKEATRTPNHAGVPHLREEARPTIGRSNDVTSRERFPFSSFFLSSPPVSAREISIRKNASPDRWGSVNARRFLHWRDEARWAKSLTISGTPKKANFNHRREKRRESKRLHIVKVLASRQWRREETPSSERRGRSVQRGRFARSILPIAAGDKEEEEDTRSSHGTRARDGVQFRGDQKRLN